MGYPTKIQLIKRKDSEQWYINFPAALAQAMGFQKSEVVEWEIENRHTLRLNRTHPLEASLKKKTVDLLSHFNALWDQAMDAFAQKRTGQRARRLSLSQLACLGRHTITGLLCSSGRQFVDWSADYRLFSKDRWQPQGLFKPVITGILAELPGDTPFVTALDDTHLPKTGSKIPGVAYRRDPLSPPFHCNLIRAQRYLQLSAQVYSHPAPGPARAIPICYEHSPSIPKPKRSAGQEEWQAYRKASKQNNLSTHAVTVLQTLRHQLDQEHQARHRRLIVGVDGSYCNQTVIRGLPLRTTLVGRLRHDASLFFPLRPGDQAAAGTRRQYGQPAPTPEQVRTDETLSWQEIQVFGPGGLRSFRIKTLGPLFWKKAGPQLPLRLVIIAPLGYRLRKGSKILYRKPAYLICTDPDLPLDQMVQYYLWRWDIEVNHRDEKQLIGVGQAQVRSPLSVTRQPAFAVASYAMLLLATLQTFGWQATAGDLPLPKWRKPQSMARISTRASIQQLHSEVWAYSLNDPDIHSDDFVTVKSTITKCPESQLPLASTVLYASTG